jgi:hypothetical protein
MEPITNRIKSRRKTHARSANSQEYIHPRLRSKLHDGAQLEPAPAKPENGHVREARESYREPARE